VSDRFRLVKEWYNEALAAKASIDGMEMHIRAEHYHALDATTWLLMRLYEEG